MGGKNLENIIGAFSRVFNKGFNQGMHIAIGGAYYYVLLIDNFPTTFKDILDGARELSPNFPKNDLINGREQLLKDGIIAEILPTLDQENEPFRKEFKRETFFPVNPKVLWDLYPYIMNDSKEMELIKDEFEILHDTYLSKFSCDSLKNKINSCYANAGENNSNICSLTLYFSSMWVIFSLLGNSKKEKSISMMLSGKRDLVLSRINFYEKLANQGLNIKAILDNRYKSNIIDKNLLESKKLEIKYNSTYSQGTRRITIIKDLFALDGRKLLPFNRPDPSYVGTIYFDEESINMVENIFEYTWRSIP